MDDDKCDVGCLYLGPMPEKLAETVYAVETTQCWVAGLQRTQFKESEGCISFIELNGVQLQRGIYPAIQWTAAQVCDPARKVLKPLIGVVKINGHPCQALIDSGTMGDFVSTTLAQQLNLKKTELC